MKNNLELLLEKIKEQANLSDKIYRNRDDLRYKSPHSLVLKLGRPFTKRIKPPFEGQIKACYKNCFNALSQYLNLEYCEGFAIDNQLPIAVYHAWLVNEAGEVIDPTWVDEKSKTSVYYGIIFNRDYVIEMYEKNKTYSILENYYKNGGQLLIEGFPPHALYQN